MAATTFKSGDRSCWVKELRTSKSRSSDSASSARVDVSPSNWVNSTSGGATRITVVWEGIRVGFSVSVGVGGISVEIESGVEVGGDKGVGSETGGLHANRSILPTKIIRNRKGKDLELKFIDFIENKLTRMTFSRSYY